MKEGKKLRDLKIFAFKSAEARVNRPGPAVDFPQAWPKGKESSLVRRFEEQVKRFPANTAVKTRNRSYSYRELNEAANRIARRLLDLGGLGPGGVGLLFEHGAEMIAGMLGVLKAGDFYIPLDPAYPSARLVYMLEDSNARVLLTNDGNEELARGLISRARHPVKSINMNRIDKNIPGENVNIDIHPGHPAYILYTSGSTGVPKGVVQVHGNVLHFIRVYTNNLQITADDRLTLFSSYSFDAAVMDIYAAILNGAVLYPVNIMQDRGISQVSQWLKQEHISIFHSIPTLFRYFTDTLSGGAEFPCIRFVVLGGEAVTSSDIETYKKFFKDDCIFINGLGPTESTVTLQYFIHKEMEISGDNIPVGTPVEETEVFLLDGAKEIAPVNSVGEIIYKSKYLAPGYINKQEKTVDVFVTDPVAGSGRVYRSGDLGKRLPDGSIRFVGRKDNQVKIRGYRIELAEIEGVMDKVAGIKKSAVICQQSPAGENRLVAYYVKDKDREIESCDLSGILKSALPDYMLPSFFMGLEELPLTPSGKIDRGSLPGVDLSRLLSREEYAAPGNEIEETLSGMWSQVLGIEQIGIHDNFFELGGNSLKIMEISGKLSREFKKDIPIVKLFEHSTISSLAKYLKEEEVGETRTHRRRITRDIAVIGMSCRFPGAGNVEEFWNNLQEGRETISFFPGRQLREMGVDPGLIDNPGYVKAASMVEGKELFDASFFGYTPREAELLDPQVRLFHECSWEALEDSGIVPGLYGGLIGVYGGAVSNLEWEVRAVLSGKRQAFGEFAASKLTGIRYLCTRLSYNLNLKGPSVTVQTACSTSLVAIHMAWQALSDGECDAAIAGGVTVSPGNRWGHLYEEGMILSPDGHCRPFDARGRGTIFGEGVGVVVLKPLEEAMAEGYNIYAVIKGSAINNDGNRKVGFTAPSVNGQVEVIEAALHSGGIDAESIGYVECHGTATTMGDPIEIEALTQAFKTGKKRFCKIGSVKSNIGHLDAAAGVAGFIKAVLSLKHRLIPPALHFETPNPAIDFANSPFVVNTRPTRWENETGPRRAGISSMGMGGTNAHMIIQEAPLVEPSTQTGAFQILLFSAKSAAALEKVTDGFVAHCKKNPDMGLADAAYTLQVGRQAFEHRRMLVCSHVHEAIEALYSPGFEKVKTFRAVKERPVVFMFPGQGAQYVDMGLGLYKTEPVLREEMDRCFEILIPLMGYDIKEILYPHSDCRGGSLCPPKDSFGSPGQGDHPSRTPGTGDSPLERGGPKGRGVSQPATCNLHLSPDINQTEIAQPVLFIFEYALARLLMKWGIKPYAMIGHSIGEYVAACLAGVFSLEDALELVALRGKLMQQMPGGAMVSAALSLEKLEPLLNETLSLAAVNGPSQCVVAGPNEAIEAFEKLLKEKEHESTRLHTSHAFHSKMMEPILAEFEAAVSNFRLNKPKIPFISNLTGNCITDEEVTNPAYWANHLRKTVYFSDGLSQLLEKEKSIFIELGPGQVLSKLVKQHPGKNTGHLIINLIRHPKEEVPADYFLLGKIGMLWLYGININWREFYPNEKRHRKPLPTYPFERQRYWIDGNPFSKITGISTRQEVITKKTDISDWFYIPLWKQAAQVSLDNSTPAKSCWLVFADPLGIGSSTADLLRKKDQEVVMVKIGTGFNIEKDTPDTYTYTVNPSNKTDYELLFGELHKIKKIPRQIVHLWSLPQDHEAGDHRDDPGEALTIARAVETQNRGYYSLLYLVKGLQRENVTGDVHLTVVTNNMQPVCGEEYLLPEQSTVLGPVNVIPQEKPSISCTSIDVSLPSRGKWQEQKLPEQLLAELLAETREKIVALRDNYRWHPTYEPHPLPEPGNEKPGLKPGGVYLVTGGMGNIGLLLAQYLARAVRAKLVLTGRSEFPPKQEWDQWIRTHQQVDKVSQGIGKIREIEELGGEVLMVRADVADKQQMQAAVSQAEQTFGPLNGVIHAAGVDNEKYFSLFGSMEKSQCEAHFQPKIRGLIVLEKVLQGKKLDFLVIMSSLSSILGGLGFSAYSAANIFMDAFLHQHNRKNIVPWLSVNWDMWQLKGDGLEVLSMNGEEGIEAFKRVLTRVKQGRLIHSVGDLQARIDRWIKLKDLKQEEEPGVETSHSLYERETLSSTYAPPRSHVEKEILDIWQNIFGFGNLGIYDDFFELGGDSLNVMTLSSKIHKRLNVEVPLTEFFNSPTIEKLAQYVSAAGKHTFSAIEPVETKKYYPLSPAQKRLYILQQLEKDSTSYNETVTVTLEGTFNKEKFERAFIQMINRHESLRTSFLMAADVPMQVIYDNAEFEIEYYNLTVKRGQKTQRDIKKLENNIDQYQKSQELKVKSYIKDFVRPFDLSRMPLLRVGLIETGIDKHILIYDMHHVITDGTSMEIFKRDLMALYNGNELPSLRIRYKDFSKWQNNLLKSEKGKRQEEYWLREFAGEIPILNLPVDSSRPTVRSFVGSMVPFNINKKETRGLNEMARREGVTLFMVLLAVFNVFLSKLSSQEDIVIGSPIAGRRHADLEQIIGMFVSTLALRNYPSGEKSFKEFLCEVKTSTLNAYENQEYPFEDLVEKVLINRDVSRNPIFDTMFALQNMEVRFNEIPNGNISQLRIKPHEIEYRTAKFDLNLTCTESQGRLFFTFEYCTKLFRRETIERFITYFERIISDIAENTERKISAIEVISDEEKRLILDDFNNTTAKYPKDKTIHRLFEEQVERTSDSLAVVGRRQTTDDSNTVGTKHLPFLSNTDASASHINQLSYRKLNEKSNQLACLLRKRGVKPNSIVGIMVERSLELMVGILGVMKAGGAYLPLDPSYPQERISYILEDSGTSIILSSKAFKEIPGEGYEVIELEDTGIYKGKWGDLVNVGKSNDLVYVIYTSGSTGKPKGVMIEHCSLANFIKGITGIIDFNENETVLSLTTFSFDIFGLETILPLTGGSVVVIGTRDEQLNVEAAARAINKKKVTILQVTPSRLSMLMTNEETTEVLKSLKYLLVGGEAFSPQLLEKAREVREGKIYNLYGPTETTIWSTVKEVSNRESLNIGKPIANTRIYILGPVKRQTLQPMGIAGELCIAGDGLARGYLNRPELTAEKFIEREVKVKVEVKEKNKKVPHEQPHASMHYPITPLPHSSIYRTGDLARWLPDGNIEFLGRIDHQVKIRGFRIELGEIESQLLKHDEVKAVVVLSRDASARSFSSDSLPVNIDDEKPMQLLSAYIVSDKEFTAPELKEYLSKTLPGYMIPSYFVQVNKIPLTTNGKVDRKALAARGIEMGTGVEYAAPRNEIERKIAHTWREVLKLDKVGIHENFFDLGGTSLDIIKLNVRLKEIFNEDETVLQMFRYTTISSFARYLSQKRGGGMVADQVVEKTPQVDKIKRSRANQKSKRRGNINV